MVHMVKHMYHQSRLYEGPAAPQTGNEGTRPTLQGGGTQIFLPSPNSEWIIKK